MTVEPEDYEPALSGSFTIAFTIVLVAWCYAMYQRVKATVNP